MVFPGLVVGYEASRIVLGRPHAVSARTVAGPAALFAIVILWIGVQTSTWVSTGLSHPIWPLAADALARPAPGTISVNPQASALGQLRLVTDAAVFWLALQLCRNPRRAHWMLRAVGAIVASYAAFGLIATALLQGAIPFLDGPNPGLVRSTFVNRNTFATYAGLGLAVTAASIVQLYRDEETRQDGPLRHQIISAIDTAFRRGWFLFGSGLVILVALLGAGSRAGVLSAALGVAGVAILSLMRPRHRLAQRSGPIVLVALAMVGAFALYGDAFFERIATAGVADAGRPAVYRIVARSILDAPLTGFGYGTFSDVFPMYRDRSISTSGVWDKAHNTYLEVFQGLGLPVGSALLASVAWPVARSFLGAIRRRRDVSPSLAASGAGLLVGVHSLVDFSVQIEAVALTFMALLGAGLAQSESSEHALAD